MWRVIGHPKAVALLERSLDGKHLSHAYLFVGPRHVGKTTLATDLAQALNCAGPDRPCGTCSPCTRIAAGKHPDVHIIGLGPDKKTEVSIDQIRDMQQAAALPPFEGKYKVFIIDDTESLSLEAANSLLKTLEEALPQQVYILLATAENLVLPTIISRCQRIQLHPVPHTTIARTLVESYDIPKDRAEALAHMSKGCPGWAINAAQKGALVEERSDRLSSLIGAIKADTEGRFAYAAELAQEFSKNRRYGDEILALWLDWWRDLLLVKGRDAQSITNIDYHSTLVEQAARCSLLQIKEFVLRLVEARGMLRQNVNTRLMLETLMLGMPKA
jgi:DNA polymerase-3 subunit delta'